MICKPQISSCINLKLSIQAACTVFLIFCLTIHPPLDTKYFKKKKKQTTIKLKLFQG